MMLLMHHLIAGVDCSLWAKSHSWLRQEVYLRQDILPARLEDSWPAIEVLHLVLPAERNTHKKGVIVHVVNFAFAKYFQRT